MQNNRFLSGGVLLSGQKCNIRSSAPQSNAGPARSRLVNPPNADSGPSTSNCNAVKPPAAMPSVRLFGAQDKEYGIRLPSAVGNPLSNNCRPMTRGFEPSAPATMITHSLVV